jgi:DNA-binding transcriptional ArsR family regulator
LKDALRSPSVVSESNAPIQFDRLEAHLKPIAYASRLELLSLLRFPKSLDEIHLQPGASQAGENPDRPISRQAVQLHLDKLEEAGLVRVSLSERKGRRGVHEYSLDHSRLFAITEELRKMSTMESFARLDPNATEALSETTEPRWPDGPKLVLVHGVNEGRAFPLRPSATGGASRGWILGRAKDAAVSLDYDPYVSMENSEIVRLPGEQYRILDLRSSKNGTTVNWKRLPAGGQATLRTGDVIGVGRSLLLFRSD